MRTRLPDGAAGVPFRPPAFDFVPAGLDPHPQRVEATVLDTGRLTEHPRAPGADRPASMHIDPKIRGCRVGHELADYSSRRPCVPIHPKRRAGNSPSCVLRRCTRSPASCSTRPCSTPLNLAGESATSRPKCSDSWTRSTPIRNPLSRTRSLVTPSPGDEPSDRPCRPVHASPSSWPSCGDPAAAPSRRHPIP